MKDCDRSCIKHIVSNTWKMLCWHVVWYVCLFIDYRCFLYKKNCLWQDDATQSTLASLIYFNHIEIVTSLSADQRFVRETCGERRRSRRNIAKKYFSDLLIISSFPYNHIERLAKVDVHSDDALQLVLLLQVCCGYVSGNNVLTLCLLLLST